ncbi:MAG: Hsp70 family protein, partial [Clostridia bacterium]|nr:Hsp70 family protein [Clostridia bacterium]
TLGGICTKIIDRNTTIPVKKSQVFSTAADGQTSVDIHVLQGERERADGNTTLGRFSLDGIAPAPRGVPQIEVTFDIDANGIVNVSAKDKGTGKEQHITITSSSNMSQEDIDKAVKEAEKFAEEDKKLKDLVDAKNHAEALTIQCEKSLNEAGDKISEDDKAMVRSEIEKLKEAIKSDNADTIKAATEDFEKKFYAVAEKMYKDAGAAGAGPEAGTQNEDGSFNADFTEK